MPAVSLVVKEGPVISSPPVQSAGNELRPRVTIRPNAPFLIEVAAKPAGAAESFSLRPSSGGIAAGAPDAPGLVYALLELAQRAGEDRFGLTAPIA